MPEGDKSDGRVAEDAAVPKGRVIPPDPYRPVPPPPFVIGGGSRVHGLLVLLAGSSILGVVGLTVVSAVADKQEFAEVLFHGFVKWPVILGAILVLVGLAMLIKGNH